LKVEGIRLNLNVVLILKDFIQLDLRNLKKIYLYFEFYLQNHHTERSGQWQPWLPPTNLKTEKFFPRMHLMGSGPGCQLHQFFILL